MGVEVCWRDARIQVEQRVLDELVAIVSRGEGRALPVSITIVDDAEIRRINREFLAHDEPTDVIAFDLSDDAERSVAGEVVVSAECAARVGGELGHAPATELLFYVCHGLLHLCGWADGTPQDRERMLARQREYLARIGVLMTD